MTLPDPKPEHRYKAPRHEWEFIRSRKLGPCRVCGATGNAHLHHLVGRDLGGDDFLANLVPLCPPCHQDVEERKPASVVLGLSLLDAELAYVLKKKGSDFARRYYGVELEVRAA